MYEWLEEEILAIKTAKFHLIDGPADAKLREAISHSELPLLQSYKEFVLKFGNAKLYRRTQNDSYRIGIFAGPRLTSLKDGMRVYHVGFHDGANLYMEQDSNTGSLRIFEYEAGIEREVTVDFGDWLAVSCARARKAYGKEKWTEILRGPAPFTAEELEIIDTRRRFRWRILGIDREGNFNFEVINAGSRMLPVFTLGVRSKNGQLNGAIQLNTSQLSVGQTAVLNVSCYKDLVSPQDLEIFSLPEPGPEDRERYGELGIR